jgi:hypothetical protein
MQCDDDLDCPTAADYSFRMKMLFNDGMAAEVIMMFFAFMGCTTFSVLFPVLLTFRADFRHIYGREKQEHMEASEELKQRMLSRSTHPHRLHSLASLQLAPPSPHPPSGTRLTPHSDMASPSMQNKQRSAPLSLASGNAGAGSAHGPVHLIGVAMKTRVTLDQVLACEAAVQLFRAFCVEHFGKR